MPKEEESISEEEKSKILKLATERRKKAIVSKSHSVKEAIESLEFSVGKQWSDADIQARKNQNSSCLTVNLLHKYIEQVVGDMRKNKISINVRPKSSADDSDLAGVMEGIISGIEANSRAERIYDSAGELQIKSGYGAWRVLNRYENWNSFNQECYLELIENPFCVHSDPDTRDVNGLDKQWCFIDSKMSKEEYKEMFPDSPMSKDWLGFVGNGMQYEHWWDGESVAKSEYYVREREEFEIALLSTGDEMILKEAEKEVEKHNKLRNKLLKMREQLSTDTFSQPPAQFPVIPQAPHQGQPQPQQIPPPPPTANKTPAPAAGQPLAAPPPPQGIPGMGASMASQIPDEVTIVKKRKTERFRVKRYILTANEIIEGPIDIPGEYIPVVEIHGIRTNIQGKRYTYGLIQFAKDPQRFFNYQLTAAAEVTKMTPKAPYLVTPKMIEGFENIWAASGSNNTAYLPFNVDGDAPQGPRREPPVQLGDMMRQIALSGELIKDTIGSFNIGGAPHRDQSGESLRMLEENADDSTYIMMDNLIAGVEATAIILLSQIPEVYDTERDVKITMNNGNESFMPINTTAAKALGKMASDSAKYAGLDKAKIRRKYKQSPLAKFNNLSDGNFDVRVAVGPSQSRQRRDTVDALLKAGQYYPPIANVASDLVAANLPLPEHMNEELRRRLRKIMPPGIIPSDPNEPPMPPNPQMEIQKKMVDVEGMKAQAAMMSAQARNDSVKAQAAGKQAEIASKEKIAGVEQQQKDKELSETIRMELMKLFQSVGQQSSQQ